MDRALTGSSTPDRVETGVILYFTEYASLCQVKAVAPLVGTLRWRAGDVVRG